MATLIPPGMRDTCYRALNELRRLVGLKGEGEVLLFEAAAVEGAR